MFILEEPLLFKLLHSFLTEYLPHQRNCSPNTVTSYRRVLNFFLNYIAESNCMKLADITFQQFKYDTINSFVQSLDKEKGNSAVTCNHRLTCLRTFIKYVSSMEPSLTYLIGEIEKIPFKKLVKHTVNYMSESAVETMLSMPDVTTQKGIRDQFIMILLYDTGARIQEILSVRIKDIRIKGVPIITVCGKGSKIRSIPLMEQTVHQLKRYLAVYHQESHENDYLFYIMHNGKRCKMSDDNVRKLLKKYSAEARKHNPQVPEALYPHLWRHSRAMHLYQHGMDLTLISQWLGHANLETTLIYAHADTEYKRRAIQKATSANSPLAADNGQERYCIDDEIMLKKLYGLL